MRVIKVTPQTMCSVVTFSDGSCGIASYQYNAMYNRSFPTGAHNLNTDQQRAYDELDRGLGMSVRSPLGWTRYTLYPGHPEYSEDEYYRKQKEEGAEILSYDKNIRASLKELNAYFRQAGVKEVNIRAEEIRSPLVAFQEAWGVCEYHSLRKGRRLEKRWNSEKQKDIFYVWVEQNRKFKINEEGILSQLS